MPPLVADLKTSRSTRSLDLSTSLRMPHVFVIPPEEEQQDNPPWCCFDADERPEHNGGFPSNPDVHHLLQQSEHDVLAPILRFTSVNQPRQRIPISKKLEKKQRPETIKIVENKPCQARQRDPREDSDVIEVVKVKRGKETLMDLEENTNIKRSKTLRTRASKALQSIKNVGKNSHRTHVKELWTSIESMPGIYGVQEQSNSQQNQTDHCPPTIPTKKRSLARSNSRSLSQIFQPMKPSPAELPFALRAASSVAPTEAHYIIPTANSPSLPHLTYNNTNPALPEVASTLTIDDALTRPASLKPSTKKNLNAKFSVRELHRLFSFSSSPPDKPSSTPSVTATPFLSTPSKSTPSASTSTLSPAYLNIHVEEDGHTDAHFLGVERTGRRLTSRFDQVYHAHHSDDFSTPRRLSDTSFEMILDSLHFDSLSFDPDDFDVPTEGNENIMW